MDICFRSVAYILVAALEFFRKDLLDGEDSPNDGVDRPGIQDALLEGPDDGGAIPASLQHSGTELDNVLWLILHWKREGAGNFTSVKCQFFFVSGQKAIQWPQWLKPPEGIVPADLQLSQEAEY